MSHFRCLKRQTQYTYNRKIAVFAQLFIELGLQLILSTTCPGFALCYLKGNYPSKPSDFVIKWLCPFLSSCFWLMPWPRLQERLKDRSTKWHRIVLIYLHKYLSFSSLYNPFTIHCVIRSCCYSSCLNDYGHTIAFPGQYLYSWKHWHFFFRFTVKCHFQRNAGFCHLNG